MKLALSQLNARLGDLDAIFSRIRSQILLASQQGASLFCVPAPLLTGALPGGLIEYGNFEHALLTHLESLARDISHEVVTCLIPAAISLDGAPLFEVFMLKSGRVIPMRLTCMHKREGSPVELWAPPVFDHQGIRIAVTFDIQRDIHSLPKGCDLALFFQANGFNASDPLSSGVASYADGVFSKLASDHGIWLACMAPVGGYDEAVYAGGSFVIDEEGGLVSQAPCFEEGLLVCDVARGLALDRVPIHECPSFSKEEWLWHALGLHILDSVRASGRSRVLVELDGDLPSSLLAVLAVDALGCRNVIGLSHEQTSIFTPAQEAAEQSRLALVRGIASKLHIRLIERSCPDSSIMADVEDAVDASGLVSDGLRQFAFEVAAKEHRCFTLGSHTKTDYALGIAPCASRQRCDLAPWGDVYLTELEFIARYRNRVSPVLPKELVCLQAVEGCKDRLIASIVDAYRDDPARLPRIADMLRHLEPSQIDGVLEAHIDRNLDFEHVPLAKENPVAVSLLLMLVRAGESARKMMAPYPIISSRSLVERAWPYQLAWSDTGRDGMAPLKADAFASREVSRIDGALDKRGERAREEVLGLIGGMLGLTPEQQAELMSPESQEHMKESMRRFEGQIRETLEQANREMRASEGIGGQQGMPTPSDMRPGDFPFFSLN